MQQVCSGGESSQQFSVAEVRKAAATLIYLGGSGKQLEELFQLQSWPGWEALVAVQRREDRVGEKSFRGDCQMRLQEADGGRGREC